jgi:hypothetical protein
MKCCSSEKKQNNLSFILLDIPQLLISTSASETSWKNSNDLPSSILKDANAHKAVMRLSVGAKNMDGVGISEIFMKRADIAGDVSDPQLRVATAYTKKNQNNNICMTIVNLDTNSCFCYAFTSNEGSLPVFEMYLMGYYE